MIYMLIGPSGSGKSTILKEILNKTNFYKAKQVTTRPKRIDDDNDYYYTDVLNFSKCVSYSSFKTINDEGKSDVWFYGFYENEFINHENVIGISNANEIDALKSNFGDNLKVIKINIPLEVTLDRALKRNRENKNEIIRRIVNDYEDLKCVKFDYEIDNIDLKQCVDSLLNIIKVEEYNKRKVKNNNNLNLFYGCMKSGKSKRLIDTYRRYEYTTHDNLIVLKSSIDSRDYSVIRSRTGDKLDCTLIHEEDNIKDMILECTDSNHSVSYKLNKINILFIDEVQFLTKEQIQQVYSLAKDYNVRVYAFGLLTTYKNTLFESTEEFLKLADTVTILKVKCECCKQNDATNQILSKNNKYLFEGNSNVIEDKTVEYKSICFSCYNKIKSEETNV